MTRNLRLYEQRRPCREPWTDDDPIHAPGPPVDPALRAALRGRRGCNRPKRSRIDDIPGDSLSISYKNV